MLASDVVQRDHCLTHTHACYCRCDVRLATIDDAGVATFDAQTLSVLRDVNGEHFAFGAVHQLQRRALVCFCAVNLQRGGRDLLRPLDQAPPRCTTAFRICGHLPAWYEHPAFADHYQARHRAC
jgi:hypothetical protein